MRVLGLDLSTKTGAVVLEGGFGSSPLPLYSGKIGFKKERGIHRCGAIAGKILDIAREYQPELVLIEDYAFQHKKSGIVLVEIGTVVRYFLEQEGFKWDIVTPGQVKKFVTGKGACPKDTIMKEVYKRWGFDTNDNDIADAFAIAAFGLATGGHIVNPKTHQEAVAKWLKERD